LYKNFSTWRKGALQMKKVALIMAVLLVVTFTGCTTAKTETTGQSYKEEIVLPKGENIQAERSRLTQKEKELYDQFLVKICSLEEFNIDFPKENYGQEEFERVMEAILEDYPQTRLFTAYYSYSDEYDEYGYTINGYLGEVTYGDNLTLGDLNLPKLKKLIKEIDKAADFILSEMPDYDNNTEKYRYIAEEICKNTEYVDIEDKTGRTYCAAGPLLDGEGICQAYATAYQWVCHRAGLFCAVVDGDCHTWNLVKLEDGSTYHVDLTWGDQVGLNTYFLLTQDEIEKDHLPDKGEWQATGK
jgi:transglutaminase/protease-like cytokinesis protein 3